MVEKKFKPKKGANDAQRGEGGYYLVQMKNGQLRCSCGRELLEYDDDSYVCSGGYPIFRPDKGDLFKDKFGNLYMKIKEHDKPKPVKKNKKKKGKIISENRQERSLVSWISSQELVRQIQERPTRRRRRA